MTTIDIEHLKHDILNYSIKRRRLIYMTGKTRYATKISTSTDFATSDLGKQIIEATSFLPSRISIPFRIRWIFEAPSNEIPLCPICKKKHVALTENLSTHIGLFHTTCGNKSCIALNATSYIKPQNDKLKHMHRQCMCKTKERFRQMYDDFLAHYLSNDFSLLSYDEVKAFSTHEIESKRSSNVSLITPKDFLNHHNLLSSIIHYTSFIDVNILGGIKSLSQFKFPERIYCIVNDIKNVPSCKYCGKPVKFIRPSVGYSTICDDPLCVLDKIRESKGLPIRTDMIEQVQQAIDASKYEIVHLPTFLNGDVTLTVRCKKCNTLHSFELINGRFQSVVDHKFCKVCEPTDYTSKAEVELRAFLMTDCGQHNIKTTDRTTIGPFELDLVLPQQKIAFEYDGIYWHNDDHVKPSYHIMKTNMCEHKGYQLIHIFETEWLTKQDIVKSRIKNLLGIYDKTVFARKCKVKEVSSSDALKFQNENHIQGGVGSCVRLGLYYDDELISLMTFGKPRFNKKYEWELLRFCNKLGYHIPGAAGKLLKYFEKTYKPKSLVSYADRRWSQGKLYKALGFEFLHNTHISYWYYNQRTGEMLSRIQCQKHRLKSILQKFDSSKSEHENMISNGFTRIYDCGNIAFGKTY